MGFDKAHKMAQRLHRERRQPEYRKKLGYLEKKQDYRKRAQDHHAKAERLRKLKQKALERNPNEFHFHMINSRVVDGMHQDIRKPLDPEIRQKLVKKEELLKRYNNQLLMKRKTRSHPKGLPEDLDESVNEVERKKRKRKIPKHVIFNET